MDTVRWDESSSPTSPSKPPFVAYESSTVSEHPFAPSQPVCKPRASVLAEGQSGSLEPSPASSVGWRHEGAGRSDLVERRPTGCTVSVT